MTILRPFALAAGLAIVFGAVAQAQDQQSPVAQGAAAAQQARERDLAAIVSIKIQVVLSKYQGEKKISNLPYDLTVRTDGSTANIRMITQVPVPTFGAPAAPADASGNAPTRIGPFNYKDVGTNIDARAMRLDNGRFAITLTIDDSSVYPDDARGDSASRVPGVPAFRTFRTTNSLVLRDGQSSQFTVATDKVSGEVSRADVTISVVK
jgi:hypothetical protein